MTTEEVKKLAQAPADTPGLRAPILVPVDRIRVTKMDLRGKALGDIEALARNIKERGLLYPPHVAEVDGEFYDLVHGRRRFEALRSLGVSRIPVVVRTLTDTATILDMLSENLARENLTPMQEAWGFKQAVDLGLTQSNIAKGLGLSQPHVSRRLALTELPLKVQDAVDAGGITINDAAKLLELKSDEETLIRVFNNRAGKEIGALVEQAKAKLTAKAKVDGQMQKQSAQDVADEASLRAKDEAKRRSAFTRLLKRSNEPRALSMKALVNARIKREQLIPIIVQSFIERSPSEEFEAVCELLGIERVNNPNGFGQIYDTDGYFKRNASENLVRFGYAVVLVRGHLGIMNFRKELTPEMRGEVQSLLGWLTQNAGYEPNGAEKILAEGGAPEVDPEIAKPPKAEKPAKEVGTPKAKAQKKVAQPREKNQPEAMPQFAGSPEGQMICPNCEQNEKLMPECVVCSGSGWVPMPEES